MTPVTTAHRPMIVISRARVASGLRIAQIPSSTSITPSKKVKTHCGSSHRRETEVTMWKLPDDNQYPPSEFHADHADQAQCHNAPVPPCRPQAYHGDVAPGEGRATPAAASGSTKYPLRSRLLPPASR